VRNAGLEPHEVSHGSGRKVWWKCPRGPDHEWRASPNNRTAGGTGCPFCAGRKVSVTNSLATLRPDLAKQWHPVHNGALAPDRLVAGSARAVWWKCPIASDHEWRASPHDRLTLMGGCPFCLDRRACSTNSLAATRPRIAAEWHPTKNRNRTPHDVVAGSKRRVWWRCRFHPEHEWRASVSNRVLRRSGCPFCSRRKASAEHCLEVAYPQIAREWHPTQNGGLTPASVTPYAKRTVWWLCERGHEWRTRVHTRTRRRSSCPVCSGHTRTRPAAGASAAPSVRSRTKRASEVRSELDIYHRGVYEMARS
jgi:putative zinc ribbon protein